MDEYSKLVLVDGHAMLYRAWFAFPPTLTQRDGTLINAAYGFTRILLTVIQDMKPAYICVSFDVGKTFRHEHYAAYKAHREKMPDELKAQEPLVDKVLAAINIPIIAKMGYEADDVIGSLSRQASRLPSLETVIVTGDKDVLQLVDDEVKVRVYMPARANKGVVLYNEEAVLSDLGVRPAQIPDYKGLAGDHSDNIPGVKGIGPKTAVTLLRTYGTMEGVYEHLAEIKGSVAEKLRADRESAFESKYLATIVREVPIALDLPSCEVRGFNRQEAAALFEELEFRSLISKLPQDEFETNVQEALF